MQLRQNTDSMPASGLNGGRTRRHFHTFDALRFFACLKVFLQHLPIFSFPWFNYLRAGGGIGVQFFFVLSGFLITYIICEEKQQTGRLDLKNFFVRRILRIWPLFYLMIGVAFVTPLLLGHLNLPVSDEGYEPTWWMSLLFLENYKMIFTHELPNVSPLAVMWSLCVEEHFYIIWGLLLYFTPVRLLPRVIIPCLLLAPAARIIFYQAGLISSDILTNIDLFAWGAVPAYLLAQYREQTESFVNRIPQWLKILFAALLVITVLQIAQVNSERLNIWGASLLGLLFSILIGLTLPADSRFRIGDRSILSRLGLYTYGLYLYHTLVIVVCLRVFEVLGFDLDRPGTALVFAVFSFLLSVGCSVLSYHFFEKPFLRLKKYFR
jgi:peptidoglycan/LPS O-acetylase OafA/YrhL